MPKLLDVIEWPNGLGCTPCSIEYRNLHDEQYDLKPDDINLDDLSPADYQRWNELDQKLLQLQAEGHTGKPVRF